MRTASPPSPVQLVRLQLHQRLDSLQDAGGGSAQQAAHYGPVQARFLSRGLVQVQSVHQGLEVLQRAEDSALLVQQDGRLQRGSVIRTSGTSWTGSVLLGLVPADPRSSEPTQFKDRSQLFDSVFFRTRTP